jgi:hypothetical protein
MLHDIDSNYTDEYWNEEKQCRLCDSFEESDGKCFCHESEEEVPSVGHCDFFRSKD